MSFIFFFKGFNSFIPDAVKFITKISHHNVCVPSASLVPGKASDPLELQLGIEPGSSARMMSALND